MSSDSVISLKNVGKLFYKQEQETFKEFLPAFFMGKKTREFFWALKDINLEVKKGESLGIMGHNGSGKSTLLKLIAGVTKPSEGFLSVTGKLAPMVELGAGFHPELTGRENVYLNGVILGLSREEIRAVFDEIVAFAELSDFIEVPVKYYSSGMYLRLAFAVAVHTKPDILLMDEILAVGDQDFQVKSKKKIDEFVGKGKTLLLVSHDLQLIKKTCARIVTLDHGRVRSN